MNDFRQVDRWQVTGGLLLVAALWWLAAPCGVTALNDPSEEINLSNQLMAAAADPSKKKLCDEIASKAARCLNNEKDEADPWGYDLNDFEEEMLWFQIDKLQIAPIKLTLLNKKAWSGYNTLQDDASKILAQLEALVTKPPLFWDDRRYKRHMPNKLRKVAYHLAVANHNKTWANYHLYTGLDEAREVLDSFKKTRFFASRAMEPNLSACWV
eukprot:GHVT01067944.1.p1 GENE.GHVT01067944.1~~GHVT01067944.1.p1  ORF type:complete len:212 (+),score=21.25 GHVT01067944.1:2102-2737(+)